MDLQRLDTDTEYRQGLFPVTQDAVPLFHCGASSLPATAAQAIEQMAKEATTPAGQWNPTVKKAEEDARQHAATLLNVTPGEIALIAPTSLALSMVAEAITFEPGDHVLYNLEDYPSNVYCWANLERKGVNCESLTTANAGHIEWHTIADKVTDRTKLVAISSVHFLSGYRVDLNTIGQELRKRNILFAVDAIQSMGAFDIDAQHIDILAAAGQKWLLSPAGIGVLYVRGALIPKLQPTMLGSDNVVSPQYKAERERVLLPDARRFEPGTLNFLGIAGMAASLHMFTQIDRTQASQRILQRRAQINDLLHELGWRNAFFQEENLTDSQRSGIISFMHPSHDPKTVAEALREKNIIAWHRYDRAGRALLRFAPHFYNTPNDIDRLGETLREVL